MNKNIALVVYSHYSRDARVRRYAESLAKKDFHIDVVCLKENNQPISKNIHLFFYPFGRKRVGKYWYLLEYTFFFVYSSFILIKYFLNKRYRIIHINNMPDFLVFSAFIPKLLGSKVILDIHDPMPELYLSKFHTDERSIGFKIIKFFEHISLKFADIVLTANENFRLLLNGRNPDLNMKLHVILNCPDPLIFNSKFKKEPSDSFTLMYMGTAEERFGLDIVINSLPRLIIKIPTIKFILITKLQDEGSYFKRLKQHILQLNVQNYIDIQSEYSLENIAKIIKNANVGIVLAKDGIFTEYIFPVKLLEFVQMGIPVIATKTKTLAMNFTKKQIYYLGKNTSDEFSKAVYDIYKNTSLRKTLSLHAKDYLKKYNWRNEELKYLQLVYSLSTKPQMKPVFQTNQLP